jgi:GNAT superfamily N-acetyltransferase
MLSLDDLAIRRLDGLPPLGFDCSRDAQTSFLYDRAWHDQQERLSTTYLYYVTGILAAYATVCMDALELGTRERLITIRYKMVSALKLAQLGVDRRFQGQGLGKLVVADVIALARDEAEKVGCRYVTLDAQPDLVRWYEGQGFKINKVMQKRRLDAAAARGPSEIPVSMRFDLREPA